MSLSDLVTNDVSSVFPILLILLAHSGGGSKLQSRMTMYNTTTCTFASDAHLMLLYQYLIHRLVLA